MTLVFCSCFRRGLDIRLDIQVHAGVWSLSAISIERPSQGRVGYLPLESIKNSSLENESRFVILHHQAWPKFILHSLMPQGSRFGKCMSMEFFLLLLFLRFDPQIFLLFSLSLSLTLLSPFLVHFVCWAI